MPSETGRKARFNHVAISVSPDLLDEAGRSALLAFYGDVFGWDEMPTLTKDRELFVLRCGSNEQFVYLSGSSAPMRCPELDHVGLSVGTPEQLDAMLERARKWKERDPAVEIRERGLEDFGMLKLHNFYVRYRLPLMFEVQCFEWAPRAEGTQA
ncbi:MAG: hypothetical protein ABFS41_02875 [Myxococcota bacterium]